MENVPDVKVNVPVIVNAWLSETVPLLAIVMVDTLEGNILPVT